MQPATDLRLRDPIDRLGRQSIGELVRRRRSELGLSQRDLEELSNIDQTTISRLENGRLFGMKSWKLAWLVGIMGGLDEHAPAPLAIVERRAWLARYRTQSED